MKKLILTAAALLILAGSTFQTATLSTTQIAQKTKPKTPTSGPTTDSIPPPTCPPNDPNGCGIFD
jgi:hypothetical protein